MLHYTPGSFPRENVRRGNRTLTVAHTPLKRARLPVPPSGLKATTLILSGNFRFYSHAFPNYPLDWILGGKL
jgi:hypothetical protein